MPWRIICCLVALFAVTNAQSRRVDRLESKEPWKNPSDNLIVIDQENERNFVGDQGWQEYDEVSGSGSGVDHTDDEDLLTSGSGSGDGLPDFTDTSLYTVAPTTTTTTELLSPCQQLHQASHTLPGYYVPRCTDDGNYDSLQCRGHPGTGTCWCADLDGREIPGTAFMPPNTPDCHEGKNLPPCVFMLLKQSRQGLLGAFRPKCSLGGDFMPAQCSGSICYCVDTKSGVKIPGTEVFQHDKPVCNGRTPPEKDRRKNTQPIDLSPPREVTPLGPAAEITTKVDVNIGPDSPDKEDQPPSPSNESGDTAGDPMKEPRSSVASMMTQPGILAAVIGGSVVVLLCAILLVMFIVYRMRKKDEGSYALDEPKKMPNYSYQRAPDKEFYA